MLSRPTSSAGLIGSGRQRSAAAAQQHRSAALLRRCWCALPLSHRHRRNAAAAAAAGATAEAADPAVEAFERLAAAAGVDASAVRLADAGASSSGGGGGGGSSGSGGGLAAAAGRALFAARGAPRGSVLLAVPRAACLVVDYGSEEGLSLPRGEWPRVRQGVGFREPLTWCVFLPV